MNKAEDDSDMLKSDTEGNYMRNFIRCRQLTLLKTTKLISLYQFCLVSLMPKHYLSANFLHGAVLNPFLKKMFPN